MSAGNNRLRVPVYLHGRRDEPAHAKAWHAERRKARDWRDWIDGKKARRLSWWKIWT